MVQAEIEPCTTCGCGVQPKTRGATGDRSGVSQGCMAYRDTRLLPALGRRRHVGQILDDLLGVLRLPSSRLPSVGAARGGGVGKETRQPLRIYAESRPLALCHTHWSPSHLCTAIFCVLCL